MRGRLCLVVVGLATATTMAAAQDSLAQAQAQARAGRDLYDARCAACHGASLNGGHAPVLIGEPFRAHWRGKSARALYGRILTTMPLNDPGSLTGRNALDLVAMISRANDAPIGTGTLASAKELDAVPLFAATSGTRAPAIPRKKR